MNTQKKAINALRTVMLVGGLTQITTSIIAYIMMSYPDLSSTTVRSLITIPGLVGLIISFVVGPLSLKISKKIIIIVSIVCNLAFYAAYGLVGGNGPFSLLVAATILAGVCRGALYPMVNASVGDFVTEPDKRASYIATNMALVNGGYAVITLFAGQIAARNEGANWPNAYWFLFAITLVIMIVFIILMPKVKKDEDASTSKSPQMEQEQANIVHKRSLPTIFFLMVLIAFIFTISYFTFSLNYSSYIITENQLGTSVQTSLAASIMTAFGLIAGFTYKYWAKLLKKWLVPVAYLSASIGLFTMLFVNKSIIGVYVAAALIGLGNNLAYPYITAKIMTLVSPKLISLATSLYMAFINLGTFISLYVIAFLGNLAGGGISGSITVAAFGALASAVAAVFIYVFAL